MLIDYKKEKFAFFIEAKVKTFSKKGWSLNDEYKHFIDFIKQSHDKNEKQKYGTSNLFTQLYFKQRLCSELSKPEGFEKIKKGINFSHFNKSNKNPRKIGLNEVVLRATEKLSEYSQNAFFIFLIPEQNQSLDLLSPPLTDLEENTRAAAYGKLEALNTKKWGQITWPEIHSFCSKTCLFKETLNVFTWNKNQLY
ncbi:MAG: hypothetical protein HPY46_02600 [Candidatus Aminicenantes bacterium]|nr:hypothetical protein [Candidatus Aminicenantes bacterium]